MTARNQNQGQTSSKQTSGKQNANPPSTSAAADREPAQRERSGMNADRTRPTQNNQRNEGEGNRTADREYREAATRFADEGDVEGNAEEARDALEGPEGEELERAARDTSRGHGKN
jgi:hypothetical protein